MNTQRELDIAQLEAREKSDKLFKQWSLDFLANRAKRGQDVGPGRSDAEDSQVADAGNYEPGGVGAEGGAVLPAADY